MSGKGRGRGWFSRLRASLISGAPDPGPVPGPGAKSEGADALPPSAEPLQAASDPKRLEADPARVLHDFEELRGTPLEHAALEALEAAADAGHLPEALRVAAAAALVERGELDRALALLGDVSTGAGLLLAADLRAERGELAESLRLVERVLARDFDAPGARERHGRWAAQLGVPRSAAAPVQDVTLLTPEAPGTGLRIVAEVARGGAGTVYEAVDDVLGRRVALKVYHRPAEARTQLLREATLAVRLGGTGTIRLLDADPDRGWLVMEWLPRGSLKQALARRDLALVWPIERWLEPLVETVARIHEAGLLHADLKPANVLFRASGVPVLSDLGLAQPPGARGVGGSAGYLSPERLGGHPLSEGDDIYALGRIIEDAVAVLDRAVAAGESGAPWRELAEVATGAGRPSAARLLARIRASCQASGANSRP